MENLNGKVAVVTGGASGIGRALSLAFAREGARVVVADLDDAGMAETVAEVARAGSAAIAVRTDVSRLEQVQALADRAFAEMGGVHVLCNNAGVALWGGLESATHRDWEWAIGVNLWGVIHGVRGVRPADDRPAGRPGISSTPRRWPGSSPRRASASTTRRSTPSWDCPKRCKRTCAAMGSASPCSVPWGSRRRSARARGTAPPACAMPAPAASGGEVELIGRYLEPAHVAERVLRAIRANRLYVITHDEGLDTAAPALRAHGGGHRAIPVIPDVISIGFQEDCDEIRACGELGRAARRLALRGGGRGRRRQEGQRVLLHARRASRHRVRPRGAVPEILGRGPRPPRPRHHDRRRRDGVADRRSPSHRPEVHARTASCC